jgi:hypothetical protein
MSSLPPVQIVVLDEGQLAALFFDIAQVAELLAITSRGSPGQWSLDDAFVALRERRVAALQIRYRHAGEEWWDTLQQQEDGVRLVRISHTQATRSPPR